MEDVHMERLNRGLVFWVLLLVSIAHPLSAQKTVKKQQYATNIKTSSGAGVGTASMVLPTGNPEYRVRTNALPGQAGVKVSLRRSDGSWPGEIVICENGGSAGDCTYDDSGNLDLEGVIVGPMFPPGVTGGMFIQTLQGELLEILINGGAAGSGIFVRLI
jgi:hypothetical protein